MADPFIDFLEAVAPFKATTICIHHSNRGGAGKSATFTSRGSTALPGAASQTLDVSRLKPDDINDNRRILFTEGRLAEPVKLLCQFNGDAGWSYCGDATAVVAAEQQEGEIQKLSDRQFAAWSVVLERWEKGFETSQGDLIDLKEFKGAERRTRLRTLDQLKAKRLVSKRQVTTVNSKVMVFRPTGLGHSEDQSGVSPEPASPDPSVPTTEKGHKSQKIHSYETPPKEAESVPSLTPGFLDGEELPF